VGLCGGVGSGKSAVAQLLGAHGARVLDADAAAQAALEDDNVKAALVDRFGPDILDDARRIDRSEVARRVFGPEGAPLREWLEDLLHPRVRERLGAELTAAKDEAPPPWCVVLDVPLLVEGPIQDWCDRIVFVDATAEDRRARTVADREWGTDELARREAAQASLADKRVRADHVVANRGTLGDLDDAVGQLVHALRSQGRMGAEGPNGPRCGGS
jgi:dephospho-CoA kinase